MILDAPPWMREHVSLSGHTTIGLGGEARFFASCRTDDAIVESVRFARRHGMKSVVLGGGSNVIIPDEGFDGVVIHIETTGIRFEEKGGECLLTVAAGEPWDNVVIRAIAEDLAGIECLSGIPGSAGATPIQNVGAYGQEVAETIATVHAIDGQSLAAHTLANNECAFSYRGSRFKDSENGKFIVTSVAFRLTKHGAPTVTYAELKKRIESVWGSKELPCGRAGLTIVRDAVLGLRKRKSMLIDLSDPNTRSVGSFFTNPIIPKEEAEKLQLRWPGIPMYPAGEKVKISAAWLVEQAGFHKGYTVGGAAVSENHSLALVNRGTTARELLSLADKIQYGVWKTFAVRLEREPVVLQ